VLLALMAFGCFCLLSSSVYVMNDLHDRAEDRLHPKKCKRPIASGAVPAPAAIGLVGVLLAVSLGASYFLLGPAFLSVGLAYLGLQIAYTFVLKHEVLLDVVVIGLGFVLRAIAGAVAVHVEISPWLVVCTFTLCLFMGFSKRRCELSALADANSAAHKHRKTLAYYTPDLLNHMTTLAAGIAVVSFMLYATDARTVREFGTNYLVYTLPLVVYAIFRFAFLVEHGMTDGPSEVLLHDRPFQIALVLWGACVLAIIYKGPALAKWFEQSAGAAAAIST
jgi:4-hydroxybenzoate polyprenyltransferase